MHGADGSDASCPRNSRILAAKSIEVSEFEGAKDQGSRLCGYLNKFTGKGPLRGFKPLWFVYDPRKCYLYYFKTDQDGLPMGHIDIADACFRYDVEGEEGQFEILTAGKQVLLKAPGKQVMLYWLQQLQQKRWEFCNTRRSTHRDSWCSPTLPHPPTGLVANDMDGCVFEKPSESMEKVRSDFAMETSMEDMVGVPSARSTTGHFLKQWSSDLRHSMSQLRPGRGNDSRRSIFYTANSDEWEIVDSMSKELQEHMAIQESSKKPHTEMHRNSTGSVFTFDFGKSSSRSKKPLRDMMGSGKPGRSVDSSPVDFNGSKPSEMQLRLQSQQEELGRLREELASQKVHRSPLIPG